MSNKTPKANDVATESAPSQSEPRLPRNLKIAVVFYAVSLLLVFLVIFFGLRGQDPTFVIGSQKFSYELSDTAASRQHGLSDRSSMDQNHAMIFEFDQPDKACMWMKDMHFGLDMVWLNQDKKVIKIQPSVEPDTYPKEFCAPDNSLAKYVIELDAGTAEVTHLSVGQTVTF